MQTYISSKIILFRINLNNQIMEDFVKQRIRIVLDRFNSNPTTLAKEHSVNQKTLNNQINSNTQLSSSTILLILESFEKVSAEWLLRGKGEMLLSDSAPLPVKLLDEEIISLRAENAVLREMVGLKRKNDRQSETEIA